MSETTDAIETSILSCCYLDGATIDAALSAGVTPAMFCGQFHADHWRLLCAQRVSGHSTEFDGVYAAAAASGILGQLGGVSKILAVSGAQPTTAHAHTYIRSLLDFHAKRQSWGLLTLAVESIKNGTADLAGLKESAEKIAEICAGQQSVRREIPVIADEAIRDAKEAISGDKPTRPLIYTGLPTFDKFATPMESHEYVVVGARTSHGKSSFLTQVVGHNLALGKKVAFFTLETSDKAVLKQIVAQRAQVNLRDFAREMPDKQQEYVSKLQFAKTTKNLLIFDRDIRLSALESRCRLLATSFKPDLVIIDYLGLIGVDGTGQYERVSAISKAMIPLRKMLGCTLMLGAQLGRGSEKEEREPMRTDFRDSGSIEEDAHRIIALWREPNQPLDLDYFKSSLLQLKLRDGPLTRIDCRFHAPTTRFIEN